MTNREYIVQKLAAFQVNEAILADLDVNLDAEYDGSQEVGKALVYAVEELVLAPTVSNVSESGFSVSWDKGKLGQWYLWLCKKYGVTPDNDVLGLLGVPAVVEISDQW